MNHIAATAVAILLAGCTPSLPSRPSPSTPVAASIAATAEPSASADSGLATQWAQTGSMLEPRISHTATLLLDGRVLVAGGSRLDPDPQMDAALSSTELFDPVAGTWTSGPPLPSPRTHHRAVRLADGRVLLIGGATHPWSRLAQSTDSVIFDPKSGAWTTILGPGPGTFRSTPLLLPDGLVLLTVNPEGAYAIPPPELGVLDPGRGSWTVLAKGDDIRGDPVALLPDGTVLMIPPPAWTVAHNGEPNVLVPSTRAWAFDPAVNTWTALPPRPLGFDIRTTASFDDGRIALLGDDWTAFYHPSGQAWDVEPTQVHLNPARIAIAMNDGRVLFAGASDCVEALVPPEILDTELGSLRLAWGLPNQLGSSKTLLADGRVLVAGGELACPHDEIRRGQIADAYLYDPFLVPPLTP